MVVVVVVVAVVVMMVFGFHVREINELRVLTADVGAHLSGGKKKKINDKNTN